ncbi:MAG TPA: hypothetical protein VHQ45_10035 [Gemmatimonadaceae bacterium]|nr:hypothetical protein [Gemmatimonadaceae bacterium]
MSVAPGGTRRHTTQAPGTFEARRRRWIGVLDWSYVEPSTIATLPTPGYTDAGVTAKTAFVNAALGFRVSAPDAVPLEVFAGALVRTSPR